MSKSTWKQCKFFNQQNYIEKIRWKQRGFFDHRKYIERTMWKRRGFCERRNYIEKSMWEQRTFGLEVALKNVRGKNVDISIIQVMIKK